MSPRHGPAYTIGFAAALCLVCAVLVSTLAVTLRPRQQENRALDRQRNVLLAAGLIDADDPPGRDEVAALYAARVEEATTGAGKPVYLIEEGRAISMVVLPIQGPGLWSTLHGFLALGADTTTVRGIAFYQHGETPGLGGEVDNPRWRARWRGRKAYDEAWSVAIEVIKGQAGDPEDDPHRVDGLSGATMTSNGVTELTRAALGDEGYGPFLAELRSKRGGAR